MTKKITNDHVMIPCVEMIWNPVSMGPARRRASTFNL